MINVLYNKTLMDITFIMFALKDTYFFCSHLYKAYYYSVPQWKCKHNRRDCLSRILENDELKNNFITK